MLQTKRCPFNSLNWNNSSNNSYPLLSTCCVSNIVKLLLVFVFNHLIHIPPLLSQFYKRGNQGTEFKKPTWGYAAVSVRVTTLDPDHMVPATSLLTTILHGLLNHGLARKEFIYFFKKVSFLRRNNQQRANFIVHLFHKYYHLRMYLHSCSI